MYFCMYVSYTDDKKKQVQCLKIYIRTNAIILTMLLDNKIIKFDNEIYAFLRYEFNYILINILISNKMYDSKMKWEFRFIILRNICFPTLKKLKSYQINERKNSCTSLCKTFHS